MLGDGQGTSCKATSPQLVRVLLLRPSPPHHPLLAFLRTDAFLTDDQPTTRQSTSTDHPPTCQPRGEDGAALSSAAPLALPCLLQRSPQPGPLGLAGCSLWLDSTQVLARPMATPARIWTGVGVELRGKWAPKGISVAWQDGSFFYDFFFGEGVIHLYLYLKTVLSFSLPGRLYFWLLVLHRVPFMLQAGFSGRLLLFFYQRNDGCSSFPSHLFAPFQLAGLWVARQIPCPHGTAWAGCWVLPCRAINSG